MKHHYDSLSFKLRQYGIHSDQVMTVLIISCIMLVFGALGTFTNRLIERAMDGKNED